MMHIRNTPGCLDCCKIKNSRVGCSVLKPNAGTAQCKNNIRYSIIYHANTPHLTVWSHWKKESYKKLSPSYEKLLFFKLKKTVEKSAKKCHKKLEDFFSRLFLVIEKKVFCIHKKSILYVKSKLQFHKRLFLKTIFFRAEVRSVRADCFFCSAILRDGQAECSFFQLFSGQRLPSIKRVFL
jgi:hypothetical protein